MGGYVLYRENDLHDSQADEAEISAFEDVSMTWTGRRESED